MKKSTFLIVGKHAVTAALKNTDRKIHRIFITEDALRKFNKENQNINLSKKAHIFYKSKKELDNLSGKNEVPHQGIIAEIEEINQPKLKDYLNKVSSKNINLVVLQNVTDPRNIGSVIRSAVSFNINGIIVKERSFPSKSKTLYKSASGGVEHLQIFEVSNINTTLRFLKDKGFWISAFDSKSKKDFTTNKWEGKNVLLFGSEGYGLNKKTSTIADFQFSIKMNNQIESLNIANSVSIVCHYINHYINNKKN